MCCNTKPLVNLNGKKKNYKAPKLTKIEAPIATMMP